MLIIGICLGWFFVILPQSVIQVKEEIPSVKNRIRNAPLDGLSTRISIYQEYIDTIITRPHLRIKKKLHRYRWVARCDCGAEWWVDLNGSINYQSLRFHYNNCFIATNTTETT